MSIQIRTVFYEKSVSDGIFRFTDWALVATTLGTMAEPFSPNSRYQFGAFQDFDPTDEIARIDHMRSIQDGQDFQYLTGSVSSQNLSGSSNQLHGGVHMPKTGR